MNAAEKAENTTRRSDGQFHITTIGAVLGSSLHTVTPTSVDERILWRYRRRARRGVRIRKGAEGVAFPRLAALPPTIRSRLP
jgi:hypothetical protein